MSMIPHVNGTAQIFLGTGADEALEMLGVSVEGVTFKENLLKEQVTVDSFYRAAYDYQYSLLDVDISCDLVVWEPSVLAKIKSRLLGITQGTAGPAGTLMVLQGYTYRLLITTTPYPSGAGDDGGVTGEESCWNFEQVFLNNAYEAKFGTERTIYKLEFKACWPQSVTSTNGLVLWNTDCED